MHIGNWKRTCYSWAHTGLSEIELFLCHFQQEGVRTIFIHQVNSHWHVLSWYVAGMVNATGWRWQWWLHSPARWAVPHYHHLIRISLNLQLPQCWIGQTTTEDQMLLPWPPRSPDPTPCDCFYGDILRTVSFFRLYHRICLSCKDKSLLLSQQLIVTCCSRYGRKWIISLIPCDKRQTHILLLRYEKKKLGEFLFHP